MDLFRHCRVDHVPELVHPGRIVRASARRVYQHQFIVGQIGQDLLHVFRAVNHLAWNADYLSVVPYLLYCRNSVSVGSDQRHTGLRKQSKPRRYLGYRGRFAHSRRPDESHDLPAIAHNLYRPRHPHQPGGVLARPFPESLRVALRHIGHAQLMHRGKCHILSYVLFNQVRVEICHFRRQTRSPGPYRRLTLQHLEGSQRPGRTGRRRRRHFTYPWRHCCLHRRLYGPWRSLFLNLSLSLSLARGLNLNLSVKPRRGHIRMRCQRRWNPSDRLKAARIGVLFYVYGRQHLEDRGLPKAQDAEECP